MPTLPHPLPAGTVRKVGETAIRWHAERDRLKALVTAGAVTAHEKAVAEVACRELTSERDRLKALNAELVEALEEYLDRTEVFVKASVSGGFDEETIPALIKKARAVLAKAIKEDEK